jgi:hypothetical protein
VCTRAKSCHFAVCYLRFQTISRAVHLTHVLHMTNVDGYIIRVIFQQRNKLSLVTAPNLTGKFIVLLQYYPNPKPNLHFQVNRSRSRCLTETTAVDQILLCCGTTSPINLSQLHKEIVSEAASSSLARHKPRLQPKRSAPVARHGK